MYLYFILGTAAVLLTALLTASMLEYVFTRLDIIVHIEEGTPWYWIVIFSFTSLIIGLGMAILLSMLRQGVCLVPCIWFLPQFFDDKIFGVWLSLPISDFLACLATLPPFILYAKFLQRASGLRN
jgi:Na+-driven multidrug efflux pump